MGNIYTDGTYLTENPGWHGQDGLWKLGHIERALARAGAAERLRNVCEAGCGAGEILKEWARRRPDMQFVGYEISPQAYALCLQPAPQNVRFVLGNVPPGPFDALLVIDVLEHVPEPSDFLAIWEQKAPLLVLHIPLDLSFRSLLWPELLEAERQSVGHIHFYTAASAKRFLLARGYTIMSCHYTNKYLERPPHLERLRGRVGMFIRKAADWLLPRSWAAWLIGGYSVMMVVRPAQKR